MGTVVLFPRFSCQVFSLTTSLLHSCQLCDMRKSWHESFHTLVCKRLGTGNAMTTGVVGAAVLGLLLYAIPMGENMEFLGAKRGKGCRDGLFTLFSDLFSDSADTFFSCPGCVVVKLHNKIRFHIRYRNIDNDNDNIYLSLCLLYLFYMYGNFGITYEPMGL